MFETFIVAPLAGAFVLWVARDFVIPHIAGALSRVPDLKGTWTLFRTSDNGTKIEEGPFVVRQIGNRIKGKHTDSRNGRVYKYSGFLSSGQVVLTFEEEGGEGYVIGSMIFRVDAQRKRMAGRSLYWRHNDNIMSGEDYEATRAQSS